MADVHISAMGNLSFILLSGVYILCQFLHQLCAIMEAIDEGFMFVGCAEAAA